MSLRRYFLLLLFVMASALLPGCGGGGGGGSASSMSTASGSSNNQPSGGGQVGSNVLSGRVLDGGGSGIPGAQVTAHSARQLSRWLAKDLTVTTDSLGAFEVDNLVAGESYTLTIQAAGRVALTTHFTPTANIPSVQIIVVAPSGSGSASFDLPTPLLLNPAISNGGSVHLSWQASTNPSFVGYTVFKSSSPNVSTTDTQVAVILAPANSQTNDTVTSTVTPIYYRLYEKALIPGVGSTILVGSNVVTPDFPSISSFAPTGQSNSLSTPIQIAFAQAMNESSVSLNISSSVANEVVNGTTSWSGNTLTFTPVPGWVNVRTYTVRVTGQDAVGDQLVGPAGPFTYSFGTSSGYVLDTQFANSSLGSRPPSPTGAAIRDLRPPPPPHGSYSAGPYLNFAVDRNDNVLMVDPESLNLLKYDPTGALVGTLPVKDSFVTVDSGNAIWGYQYANIVSNTTSVNGTNITVNQTVPGNVFNRYDSNGSFITAVGLNPPPPAPVVMSYESIGVDLGGNQAYYASFFDGSIPNNFLVVGLPSGQTTFSSTPATMVAVDSRGFVYACKGFPGEPVVRLNRAGSAVANYSVLNNTGVVIGLTVGPDDSFYFLEYDQNLVNNAWAGNGQLVFWKVSSSGQVVTHFIVNLDTTLQSLSSLSTPQACSLGADSQGRIYLEHHEGQMLRFMPTP